MRCLSLLVISYLLAATCCVCDVVCIGPRYFKTGIIDITDDCISYDFRLFPHPHLVLCVQGSMDVKYLQDRYAKGMDRVHTLLKHSQRFVHVDDLMEAANDVVQQLNENGTQSLLSTIHL